MTIDQQAPISLTEDVDTGDRFLIYATASGVKVDLQVEGDTFWGSQAQMADVFGVTRQNISLHLQNIYKEGELEEATTCKESLRVGQTGQPYRFKIYDLNALISVGYRIGGPLGTSFRIWATDKLVRYLTKGFVIDAQRLKAPGNQDRVTELREIVRDIRSAEANLYAELRRICALCQDYDPRSDAAHQFYARMQAKLFWAVTSHTPSEILRSRANAERPNVGLTTWEKAEIRQSDAIVAKNFLVGTEIKELNRLTVILLDVFEDQLDIGRLTLMPEANRLLDAQLRGLGRPILSHGGSVAHVDAEAHAKAEYRKFDAGRRAQRVETYAREIAALTATEKALPARKGRRQK